MKNVLILGMHSVSDIITNSSSELFVCNTEKTKKEIFKFLEGLTKLTGQPHGVSDVKVFHGYEGFCEIIEEFEDYINGAEDLIRLFVPQNVEVDFSGVKKVKHKWGSSTDWEEEQRAKKEGVQSFLKDNKEVLTKYCKTIVTIYGGHNEIPYKNFELIKKQFNGMRYHLG